MKPVSSFEIRSCRRPPNKSTVRYESPRTPPMRATPLPIQLRLHHLRQRRPRHHRAAGGEREPYHRAGMRHTRRSERPGEASPSQRASPRAAPSTPSTPPPSAVVRELRERRDPTLQRVRIEHMRCAVCNQAVEETPTRVPPPAGGGVWGGVCEGGGSELPID